VSVTVLQNAARGVIVGVILGLVLLANWFAWTLVEELTGVQTELLKGATAFYMGWRLGKGRAP
jgi:hypothetical protein